MGESEKLVRSLFEMARAEKSAIIFIDEVWKNVEDVCGWKRCRSTLCVARGTRVKMMLLGESRRSFWSKCK